MRSKIQFLSRKIIIRAAFAINSFALAYSLAARFTDFLFAPRAEKVWLLLGCLMLSALASAMLYLIILGILSRGVSRKLLFKVLIFSILITAFAFVLWYAPPPFPEQHTLRVTALGESGPEADGTRVHLKSVRLIYYPSGEEQRVPKTDFTYEGVWRGVPGSDYEIFVEGGTSASIQLDRFVQAGAALHFATGPDSGLVRITWDNREFTRDLYQPQEGGFTEELKPAFDWRSADRTRQVLVAAAFTTDLTAAVSLLTILLLALVRIKSGQMRLDIREGRVFLLGATAILLTLVITQLFNQPVQFNNPPLENGVRVALNNPDGNIYQRQLKALVELDLSNQGALELNGIENLKNVITLDLSGNQIRDITPLAHLRKLEHLNLRGNQVSDLTPLSEMARLEYLNLYGNIGIPSISPISGLSSLKKLILAQVPVSEGSSVLSGLNNLQYLNLRNSQITRTDFLSPLANLTYLNLYNNAEIERVDGVFHLKKLETLILAHIPVGEQAGRLSELPNLQYLNLRNTGVSDISFLQDLEQLEYLNLRGNPNIRSIAPIAELGRLRHLILRDVPVSGQTNHLVNLVDLETLNLRSTGISDPAFLAELAAQGALQDNPKQNIKASVDIRDNPILMDGDDPYASLRPYWEGITFKEPAVLPFYAALNEPIFSQQSGFYENGFHLALSHVDEDITIFYTLDGSAPTAESRVYADPILISAENLPGMPASQIETVASNYEPPQEELPSAQVVRAKAVHTQTGEESAVASHTYFIGPDVRAHHTLPIVSISADFDDLFNPQDGIYVLGEDYLGLIDTDMTEDEKQAVANFNQRGQPWERPVHIEFLSTDGQPLFSQNAGVRIHGGGSRRNAQKSLRVNADCAYDSNCLFAYPIFQPLSASETIAPPPRYTSFLLRNNGQDWLIGMMRDALALEVLEGTGLDLQSEQPVIAYLNGEYWGIYQLQERYDAYYLLNHYGIQPGGATILRQDGDLFRGSQQDAADYAELMDFVRGHDLADPQNFSAIEKRIDLENYTDYLIANIFLANTDWPDNNIYIWRKSLPAVGPSASDGHDGRWRWMVFDMDFAFGLQGYGRGYEHNTLQLAQKEGWSGELLRSLLENEDYQAFFLNRFVHHLNTTFTEDRLLEKIDQKHQQLAPEMGLFFARWGSNKEGWMERWNTKIADIRVFAQERKQTILQHLTDQFGLRGTVTLRINPVSGLGTLSINGEPAESQEPWQGTFFAGVPITITAVPEPGYQFSHWVESGETQAEITLTLDGDTELTPVFDLSQSE